MNIGITGASGFIGNYLLKYLSKNKNYKLYALTRTKTPFCFTEYDNVIWKIGDLCSKKVCEEFIMELDIIIHLAHNNNPLNSNYDIPAEANLNLLPNLNLLDSIKKYRKGIHFIYASSGGAIYGKSAMQKPFNENDLCLPQTSYGIQKLTMEHYLRLWAENSFLTASILRIGNPYGVILPYERKQGLIGVAFNQILKKQPVYIFGNPDNVRDYIHLNDLCRVIDKCFQVNKKFDIYNIAGGKGYSVNQILLLIEECINYKIKKEIIHVENDINLVDWIVLDIRKAKNDLSWEPSIGLEEGIRLLSRDILNVI